MRYFLAIFVLCVLATVGVLGFRGTHFRKTSLYIFPDMEWQLKYRPQKPSGFFANGRTSPTGVAGRASDRLCRFRLQTQCGLAAVERSAIPPVGRALFGEGPRPLARVIRRQHLLIDRDRAAAHERETVGDGHRFCRIHDGLDRA